MMKILSCLLIVGILSVCIPHQADAIGPIAQRAGDWINSPQGQETMRRIVQSPSSIRTAKKVWNWVKERATDVKEGIAEGLQELSQVNPMCTVCTMTGVHVCNSN